jgi:hypothetical protein
VSLREGLYRAARFLGDAETIRRRTASRREQAHRRERRPPPLALAFASLASEAPGAAHEVCGRATSPVPTYRLRLRRRDALGWLRARQCR